MGIFHDIPADSDLATVDAATAFAREAGVDCVVSVGGGSVIDTAKAVCVTVAQRRRSQRPHRHHAPDASRQLPHIAIPTTAGTGSEVTNMAVIHNHDARAQGLHRRRQA